MRVLISLIAILPAAFAQYTSSPAGPAPAAQAFVQETGLQVVGAGGKVWCEMWFAKSLPAGAASTGEAVSLPSIPHGAFLGIARFPANAQDRRGNLIKAGVYAMRYSVYPADGNHMGAAPQRDFAILIPAGQDKPPAEMLPYDKLMALSAEANGVAHPAVLSLAPSSETT